MYTLTFSSRKYFPRTVECRDRNDVCAELESLVARHSRPLTMCFCDVMTDQINVYRVRRDRRNELIAIYMI